MSNSNYGRKKKEDEGKVLRTVVEYVLVLGFLVVVGALTLHNISGPLTSVFSQLNSGFQQH